MDDVTGAETIQLPEPVHDQALNIKGRDYHAHCWKLGPYRFVFTMDRVADGRYHVVTFDGEGDVVGTPIAYATFDEAEQAAAERYGAMLRPDGKRYVWSIPKMPAERDER